MKNVYDPVKKLRNMAIDGVFLQPNFLCQSLTTAWQFSAGSEYRSDSLPQLHLTVGKSTSTSARALGKSVAEGASGRGSNIHWVLQRANLNPTTGKSFLLQITLFKNQTSYASDWRNALPEQFSSCIRVTWVKQSRLHLPHMVKRAKCWYGIQSVMSWAKQTLIQQFE